MDTQCLQNLSALNMEFLEVGNVCLGKSWNAKRICSPYTRIYMVTEGVGYLRFDNTVIRMTSGNIYVIPAGFTFSYDCEPGFTKMYFHISLCQPSGYDVFNGTDRCLSFSDPDGILLIKKNFSADSVTKIMTIKSFIASLVCRCLEQNEDTQIGQYSDHITDTLSYIEKNLSSNLTVNKIADAIFISPAKIRKSFRDELGISIGKYIDDCVMLAAEREVRSGIRSIHEISERLGFCDQFYFSRCFTAKYGMSPRKYRKIHFQNNNEK